MRVSSPGINTYATAPAFRGRFLTPVLLIGSMISGGSTAYFNHKHSQAELKVAGGKDCLTLSETPKQKDACNRYIEEHQKNSGDAKIGRSIGLGAGGLLLAIATGAGLGKKRSTTNLKTKSTPRVKPKNRRRLSQQG